MVVRVAVPKETATGERRVALVPDVVPRLSKLGYEIHVEAEAGAESYYPSEAYRAAGATIESDRKTLVGAADLVLHVQAPPPEEVGWMRPRGLLVGLLAPGRNPAFALSLCAAHSTAFALELVPRITRAQSMDALSSQATVAGYRAVLIGADLCPKFFPMLTTAAGTIRPALVLVLGAGVAGLTAISTARRLGAVVQAYDVRRAAGEQVRSLGAKFLELNINAEGTGGYARELTSEEKVQEHQMVSDAVAQADVVITTAAVPGRRAPRLIDAAMVARMRPGAAIVDLAAESGGNCELTRPGETVTDHGVNIVGAVNLPSQLPYHASQMYAKNLESFLSLLVDKEGNLVTTFSDEILAASMLVNAGEIVNAATRELVEKAA